MREFLQKHLIRFIIKDVFHLISKEDILKVKANGVWEWKGKELSSDTKEQLMIQAAAFKNSTLWKILKAELEWSATKTLLEKGTSEMDIRVAQIQGYITKVIDDKLEIMK